MSSDSVVILGFDAVSPLGIDFDSQWQKALAGESGVGPLTRFPLDVDFPVRIAGQVPAIDHLPHDFLKPREQARWPSPIFKYALLTVTRALEKSGLTITPDLAPRTAITFSSAIGGLDAVLAGRSQADGPGQTAPRPLSIPTPASTWSAARFPCIRVPRAPSPRPLRPVQRV